MDSPEKLATKQRKTKQKHNTIPLCAKIINNANKTLTLLRKTGSKENTTRNDS
jgi:hypothetical protein